jgi:hypothetical protein
MSKNRETSATAVAEPPVDTETPVTVGEPIIFIDGTRNYRAAIATNNQREDGRLDLTYFPPGMHPIPLLGVEPSDDGKLRTWHRRRSD